MQVWRTCAKNFVQNPNIFSSKSEIVWKVIFFPNFCFSSTRSPRHVDIRKKTRNYTFQNSFFKNVLYSSNISCGHVDCSYSKPAIIFLQKLENCSLWFRPEWKKWKRAKKTFPFLKHFFRTTKGSFDNSLKDSTIKIQSVFAQSPKLNTE